MADSDEFVLPPSPPVRCDVAMTRATYDALTARLSSAEAEVERLRAEVDAMGLAMLRIRREAETIQDALEIIDPFDLTAAARRQQGGTDAR